MAWGLVDAIMYLMNVAIERGHALTVIKKIHATKDAGEAGKILKSEIQPAIASLMKDEEHHIDFLETQLDLIKSIGLELYTQKHVGGLTSGD